MTTQTDFTPDEWTRIVQAPTVAGMILLTAEGGGTFRETFALAKAYTDARQQHGQSRLLDQIVAGKPDFDRHRYGSNQELRAKGLDEIAEAASLVRAKGTPEDVAGYRAFVVSVASRVASAHKEHGQEVSPAEQSALDEIQARLAD